MNLQVYLNQVKVGTLALDAQSRFQFHYDASWLLNAERIPLSLRLPLSSTLFNDEQARPFFAGLLPEGEIRNAIGKWLRISPTNDFELLREIGGECAGAVSLWPEGHTPDFTEDEREITSAELLQKIKEIPQRPLISNEDGMRISLAGVQEKASVLYHHGKFFEPMGFKPGTFILKPALKELPDSVHNEAFCMSLAAKLGLQVPPVSIVDVGEEVYVVSRFDRMENKEGKLSRVHQEDFCQALGLLPNQKYQNEGGPGVKECLELTLNFSQFPIEDRTRLLYIFVFNYLIGNADAHGKNFSWLITPQGFQLAPFYDLLSTAAYENFSDKMAMAIGGEKRLDWIFPRHWLRMLEENKLDKRLFVNLQAFADETHSTAQIYAKDFIARYGGQTIVRKITKGISQRHKIFTT